MKYINFIFVAIVLAVMGYHFSHLVTSLVNTLCPNLKITHFTEEAENKRAFWLALTLGLTPILSGVALVVGSAVSKRDIKGVMLFVVGSTILFFLIRLGILRFIFRNSFYSYDTTGVPKGVKLDDLLVEQFAFFGLVAGTILATFIYASKNSKDHLSVD